MTHVIDGRRYASGVGPTTARRQRRPKHDPETSRLEILHAAEALLRERPLREISVDAVMSRTGLKRPAFYAHFRDRNDLVLHVVRAIGDDLLAATRPWLEGDSLTDVRTALEGLVSLVVEHGPLLRALSDAAAADAQVEDAYRDLILGFIDATAAHIRDEQAAGRVGELPDVQQTARALIWMEERFLLESLARDPTTDPRIVVDVLERIWTATLYGPTTTGA